MTKTSIPDVVRTIEICAPRATVFRYFTDPARFAAWWGEGSTVDARPGGAMRISYPNGQKASGTFREVVAPERVVFTFGNEGADAPIPPGGSTVIVTLDETPRGTRVTLRHTDFPNAEIAGQFVQGWRYQLSMFSKAVAAERHAGIAAMADAWFAAWNETDAARRRQLLASSATSDVEFFDDFGALSGHEDLDAQIAATKIYMPGMTLARVGEPARSHGNALVRWEVRDPSGRVTGTGVNAVTLAPDGRFARVVGYWGA